MCPTPATSITSQPSETETWRDTLQSFCNHSFVELSFCILILISVILTLSELSIDSNHPMAAPVDMINYGLSIIFLIELTLRFLIAERKLSFFYDYWPDCLALLPLVPLFRSQPYAGAVRFLRLFRLFRLVGLFHRYSRWLPQLMRRSIAEYVMVFGLLIIVLMFSTAAILAFEKPENSTDFDTLTEAFWFSLFSLFAGEPIPGLPETLGGRIVTAILMFMSLTLFAFLLELSRPT